VLKVPIYFCDPASPWQRGSVENANGLIRQYAPKRTSFDNMDLLMPSMIEETLNHRPRKTLGYRTPREVFFDEKLDLLPHPKLLRLGLEFSRKS
jgi:transposase, IS30 family